MLLLPRLDADALVHEGALQVPAGARSPTPRSSRRTAGAGAHEPEFELADTGVFDGEPLLRRHRRVRQGGARRHPRSASPSPTAGPRRRASHVLPTLWFRNTWSWGRDGEGYWREAASIARRRRRASSSAEHASLGRIRFWRRASRAATRPSCSSPRTRPTASGSSASPNATPYVKDAFHEYVVDGRRDAVNPAGVGTKAAAHYRLDVPAGGAVVTPPARLASADEAPRKPFGADFERVFDERIREADAFYAGRAPGDARRRASCRSSRQAYAGLLWSKQFYHYVVRDWLDGDPAQPPPPPSAPRGPQPRLAAPLQPRRHLDARQVGVPLVRGVGPRVPHDPVRAASTRTSPRSSSCCSCASGTCTRTARSGLRVRRSAT